MAKKTQQAKTVESGGFFEIVNWKKAQPRMKGGGQDWMKLYTSLLDHEGFAGLDSTQQMTIVALWLYAARTGHHVLPADPKWLYRRIPLLKEPPELGPLAEAVDAFGNPNPFIRFCEPPKARKTRSPKSQEEKSRVEENREEKREESRRTLTGSEEEKRERKDGLAQTQQTETEQPEEPENPKESEVGPAKVYHVPRPARSAFNRRQGPQRIGAVIGDWLPEHWRDQDAEAFGWEIVRALGYAEDRDDQHSRAEWGAFAKFWCEIKSRASPMLLGELRGIAVKKATFVNSPKAKSARNKSAVWFEIMYGELNKHGIQIPRKKSRSG